MPKILEYTKSKQSNILETLERYVKAESPSNRKDLVDKCGKVLQDIFIELIGIQAEVYPQTDVGDHLKFTYGNGDEQILILCHMDTVWDQGKLPFRIEGNYAYGPGILDMKGGATQAIWAIKTIKDLGIKLNKKIVFIFNSDEEIGSPTSRTIIEKEALKSSLVLVAEPPSDDGSLKTQRKGVGRFKLQIKGVAAHSGNNHEDGVSAIEELARQIIYLHSLTDYSIGTTVNVGVVKGGSKTNVIAGFAEADIDFRVETLEEGRRMENLIGGLQPRLKGATIELEGRLNRPPMERTASTLELFEKVRKIGQELGLKLTEASAGGGSDGNFTSALGIPTLDGLGALGAGPHAELEHIVIDQLPIRTAMFAHILIQI